MKILLVTFCVITGLFGGGCVLLAGGINMPGNPMLLIPAAVFIFNLLVIVAVLGWSHPWPPAFYALAVVDLVIALATLLALLIWARSAPEVTPWGLLLACAFALKGYLTWRFIRQHVIEPG